VAVTATLAREIDVGLQRWLTVCLVSAALATARSYVWVGTPPTWMYPSPAALLPHRGCDPPPAAVTGSILPFILFSTMDEITPVGAAPHPNVWDSGAPAATAVDGARAASPGNASRGSLPLPRLAPIFGGSGGQAMSGRLVGAPPTTPVEAAAAAPGAPPSVSAEADMVAAAGGGLAEGAATAAASTKKSRRRGYTHFIWGFFQEGDEDFSPRSRTKQVFCTFCRRAGKADVPINGRVDSM